jgi:C-terminal processing protease CtpA/Prc
MPNTLTRKDKVYGLSRFWQEVNYNFVYLNKIDRVKWDEVYKQSIAEVQQTSNDYEYYCLLQKFCALLKDGHTNVYMPQTITINILNAEFGDYRLFLSNINGKAIVTRINFSKMNEIPIGTEITKVNGLTAKDYADKYVKPYISSSTDHILNDWTIRYLFRAPLGTKYDVEMKFPDGKTKSLNLVLSKTTEDEMYPVSNPGSSLLDFRWINKEMAYISLNSFESPKIDSLFIEKLSELYAAKALIIDLRKNGGGNTTIGREIFRYLTNDTVLYGSKMQSRLHIPTLKAWGNGLAAKDTVNNSWARRTFLSSRDDYYYDFTYQTESNSAKIKRLVIPTILLIGHNTASAAEDFLIYADNQKHITKIGEPTFGSTGQPLTFDMPGGGSARVCTKKDTYPDGREFVGYGVKPDIEVRTTLKDYLENTDPALQKAIEYLKKALGDELSK